MDKVITAELAGVFAQERSRRTAWDYVTALSPQVKANCCVGRGRRACRVCRVVADAGPADRYRWDFVAVRNGWRRWPHAG